jgi:MFS superfamily sulfate permease-like transporter
MGAPAIAGITASACVAAVAAVAGFRRYSSSSSPSSSTVAMGDTGGGEVTQTHLDDLMSEQSQVGFEVDAVMSDGTGRVGMSEWGGSDIGSI